MRDPRPRRRARHVAILGAALTAIPTLLLGAAGALVTSSAASITAAAASTSNCSPAPSPSPSASPSPTASPSPSTSPTASPTPSPGQSPSPTPTPVNCTGITASPSSGLADGQYVKLTFHGLQPYEGIVFRQCIATWANVNTDCTPTNTRILGVADQAGAGSTYFPVNAYANDLLKNSQGVPIPCDSKHVCAIVGFSNYKHVYQSDISFALSPDACPPIGPNAVGASGSAGATRAMFRWTASLCLPPKSLQVTYITSNEHAAYDDLARGLTEFGITGLGPYPPAGETGGPSYKLAPLTASAVVLAYRAYDMNGTQITNLTLTPDIIAGLFMGQINNFSASPAITALNPGIAFPPRVQMVARAEFNTETYILNSWLKANSPSVWKPPTSPSPDIFPATGIDLKFGERAAALDIIDPPAGFDASVVYIGAIDSSTAAFYGLPTVKIGNPDGSTVSATPDSILEGINDSTLASDGTLVPVWNNSADPDAYPMPNVTYLLAPTNKIDPNRGKTVAAFLSYAVLAGQSFVTGVDGYVKLPVTLVADSLSVAAQIPVPVPPPPAVHTTPPPSLPPLPSLPPTTGGNSVGGASSGCASGTACTGGGGSPTLSVATLSYSQGLGLVAAIAQQKLAVPSQYVLPALIAVAVLMTLTGIGLQLWTLWARRRVRAGPPT